jgi:hypothetical protein
MTKIKVYETGKCVKTITNASINYGQDYEQLRKMGENAIRLSPQDPIYNVEKIFVANEGKDIELDQSQLEQFQNILFRPENQLMIHVGEKKGKVSNRINDSENQENSGDCNILKELVHGQAVGKKGSALRAGSPLTKCPITPNKIRSVSRSRCSIAIPSVSTIPTSSLPRGMSPARSGPRHLSVNSRPISELIGASLGSLAADKPKLLEEKPKLEDEPEVTPTSDNTTTSIPTTVTSFAEVSIPELIANEVTEVKQEKPVDLLAMHETYVQQMEQKSRESIEGTWAVVGGESNSPIPVKNVAPFAYYSPPPPPPISTNPVVAASTEQLMMEEEPAVEYANQITGSEERTEAQSNTIGVNPLLLEEESSIVPMTPIASTRVGSSDSQMSAPKSPSVDDASVFSGNNRRKTPIRSCKKSMFFSSSVKTPNKSANTAITIDVPPTTGGKTPVFPKAALFVSPQSAMKILCSLILVKQRLHLPRRNPNTRRQYE